MKLGKFRFLILTFLLIALAPSAFSDDKIVSVPLINLEELSPTFEEGKDELEKLEDNSNLNNTKNLVDENKSKNNNKVYINLTALDKLLLRLQL